MKKKVENKAEKKVEKVEKVKQVKPKKLNYKLIAVLYVICAVCWFISGIINYNFSDKLTYITDFVLTVVWICLAIFYFRKKK